MKSNSPASSLGVVSPTSLAVTAAVLANALILVFPLAAGLIERSNSELYYSLVQEDGALEWMTVWAFLLAAAALFLIARDQRRAGQGTPWLTFGLALFCFVFAMEEISWGQRVLGYRPPEYFLKENFQQEFNFHNVISTSLRKLVLKSTILGYGVVLPFVALAPPLRKLLQRHGPLVPPLALTPSFLATYWIYESYPWRFSGEIIELMLGLAFLFTACAAGFTVSFLQRTDLFKIAAGLVATTLLGLASFAYSHYSSGNDPARITTARGELKALAADFTRGGRPISKCSVHKRVFSWAEKYSHLDRLAAGRFARLAERGLPEARAQYFIDPWNSPFWIRHKCSKSSRREVAFLYSFGPNRRRDSTDWEIAGDDIGVFLLERERLR